MQAVTQNVRCFKKDQWEKPNFSMGIGKVQIVAAIISSWCPLIHTGPGGEASENELEEV